MLTTKLPDAIECSVAEKDRQFFEAAASLPHYLIDRDIYNMILDVPSATRDDMTMVAMTDGAFHLPFPQLLVEVEGLIPETVEQPARVIRLFSRLTEGRDADGQFFHVAQGQLKGDRAVTVDLNIWLRVDDAGKLRCTIKPGPNLSEAVRSRWTPEAEANLRVLVGSIIDCLTLAPRIRGVELSSTPAPAKLNKARAAKGRPPIPEFTVLRVGHAYDRAGNKVSMPTGRTMPVHLRAGHSRGQHYGKGNALLKTVYIRPTIVNFDPNVEVPMPKRILAA